MFQRRFKGDIRKFQGCCKRVLKVLQGIFKGVSRNILWCCKEVSRVFEESFKGVSRKIEGCFNGDLSGFQRYLEEFQGSF